ncbi:YceH family protein [Shewanella maritima]|uniref:YceH family protein n=1 Tax=Shewanella maritima TaxID=2520507 RepID=UPI003735193E
MELNANQTRVIGCLLEKEVTTPDQYPLSLNSLTLACNQKSSREPVMALSEQDVQQTLDELAKKRLISEQSGFGSRVVKYQHRFCNTEFSENQFSPEQVAVICVLMLRGAQTPGELKSRCNRLHAFEDAQQVEAVLVALSQREKPLVAQLPKQANRRDHQYIQLFSELDEQQTFASGDAVSISADVTHKVEQQTKISALEEKVAALELRITELEALIK